MRFILIVSAASVHVLECGVRPRESRSRRAQGGAEIKKSPDEIKIWFSDEIEPAFSTITVQNQSGSQIDNRDTHVDSHNPKLLIVSVPKLDAGVFTVTWKVTAKDTHRTHGDFKFTIKAGS